MTDVHTRVQAARMARTPDDQRATATVADDLRTAYPAAAAALVAEGVAAERSRVAALLKMGTAAAAMSIATKAILDGTASTDDALRAAFLDAQLSAHDRRIRQRESDAADDVLTHVAAREPASETSLIDAFANDLRST